MTVVSETAIPFHAHHLVEKNPIMNDVTKMKVTLNGRLIPPNQRNPAERLVKESSLQPRHLLIEYRDELADQAVLAIDAEDASLEETETLSKIHRIMEEGIRAILSGIPAADRKRATLNEARIWVKTSLDRETLDGLDVEIIAAMNLTPSGLDDPAPARYPATLVCTGMNDYDEMSVRLVSNHPLEDENGREVYHLDLDQASISSLRKDRNTDTWTIRLPDRCRPIR